MENHHFLWVNQLFLWPFSIAIMFVYQRVNGMNVKSQSPFASIKSFRCACRIRCESLQASKYKKHRKYLYGTMDRTDRTCFQLRRYQTYYNIYILPSPLERKMKHDIVQPSQYATPAIWSPKVLPQWRSMCWQAADCLPGINSSTPGSH